MIFSVCLGVNMSIFYISILFSNSQEFENRRWGWGCFFGLSGSEPVCRPGFLGVCKWEMSRSSGATPPSEILFLRRNFDTVHDSAAAAGKYVGRESSQTNLYETKQRSRANSKRSYSMHSCYETLFVERHSIHAKPGILNVYRGCAIT